MKKIFLVSFFALTCCASSIAQKDTAKKNPVLSAEHYMQKSKKQKTAAQIMLYGGGVFVLTAVIIGTKEADDAFIQLFGGEATSNFTAADIFFWTGLASMAGSIPLFIASGKNRRNASAAKVSIDFKRNYRMEPFTVKSSGYPALTIKLSL